MRHAGASRPLSLRQAALCSWAGPAFRFVSAGDLLAVPLSAARPGAAASPSGPQRPRLLYFRVTELGPQPAGGAGEAAAGPGSGGPALPLRVDPAATRLSLQVTTDLREALHSWLQRRSTMCRTAIAPRPPHVVKRAAPRHPPQAPPAPQSGLAHSALPVGCERPPPSHPSRRAGCSCACALRPGPSDSPPHTASRCGCRATGGALGPLPLLGFDPAAPLWRGGPGLAGTPGPLLPTWRRVAQVCAAPRAAARPPLRTRRPLPSPLHLAGPWERVVCSRLPPHRALALPSPRPQLLSPHLHPRATHLELPPTHLLLHGPPGSGRATAARAAAAALGLHFLALPASELAAPPGAAGDPAAATAARLRAALDAAGRFAPVLLLLRGVEGLAGPREGAGEAGGGGASGGAAVAQRCAEVLAEAAARGSSAAARVGAVLRGVVRGAPANG